MAHYFKEGTVITDGSGDTFDLVVIRPKHQPAGLWMKEFELVDLDELRNNFQIVKKVNGWKWMNGVSRYIGRLDNLPTVEEYNNSQPTEFTKIRLIDGVKVA